MATNSLGSSLDTFREKIKEGMKWITQPQRLALLALLAASPMVKGQNVSINGSWAAADPSATLHINRTDNAGTFIPGWTPLLTQGNAPAPINGATLWNQSNSPGRTVRLLLLNGPSLLQNGSRASYIEWIANTGWPSSPQSLGFGTAVDWTTPAQERMRLTGTGYLWIGTQDPLEKLDLRSGKFRLSSPTVDRYTNLVFDDTNTEFSIELRDNNFDPSYKLFSIVYPNHIGLGRNVVPDPEATVTIQEVNEPDFNALYIDHRSTLLPPINPTAALYIRTTLLTPTPIALEAENGDIIIQDGDIYINCADCRVHINGVPQAKHLPDMWSDPVGGMVVGDRFYHTGMTEFRIYNGGARQTKTF